ncbi:phosphoglycerate transporter [Aeromicrobium sp. Root236]|uniref:uridine kinase family protein n=1 Tax=Aeromicrobium sp. Root236 TaxID=1736498 RepID=UPI0006FE6B8E|nr:hypothetical protein [Aeromicrobium sp. Root236]KRC65242.1 phosphoglycerate transporter [Aeromicrobium sp. Root236]
MTLEDVVAHIEQLRDDRPRTVVAVSGFAGSGKSTLAKALASTIPSCLRLRGDDFLDPVRSHRRSYDWDGVERARMRKEVLDPYRLGQPVRFRPLDWTTRALAPATALPDVAVLVVDAIGVLHPDLDGCFDLTVWVDVELETAGARGRRRDLDGGHDHERLWTEVWQRNDADFADRFDPRGEADVLYVPDDVAARGMP